MFNVIHICVLSESRVGTQQSGETKYGGIINDMNHKSFNSMKSKKEK